MTLDPRIAAVTDRIIERSKPTRQRYLDADGRARPSAGSTGRG